MSESCACNFDLAEHPVGERRMRDRFTTTPPNSMTSESRRIIAEILAMWCYLHLKVEITKLISLELWVNQCEFSAPSNHIPKIMKRKYSHGFQINPSELAVESEMKQLLKDDPCFRRSHLSKFKLLRAVFFFTSNVRNYSCPNRFTLQERKHPPSWRNISGTRKATLTPPQRGGQIISSKLMLLKCPSSSSIQTVAAKEML